MTISGRTRVAAWAMAVFVVAIASRVGFGFLGPGVGTLLWKLFWVALCFTGVALVHGLRPTEAFVELGLAGSLPIGLGIGSVAFFPMILVFAPSWGGLAGVSLFPMLSTTLLAPVTEELLFRGYLFRQLYRHAGWSATSAVLTTAILFGLAHAGRVAAGSLGAQAAELGMITLGGAFYAWLFVRWQYNLWVPICVHAFMNLACALYGCDLHPGSWPVNLGRIVAVGLTIAVTVMRRRLVAKSQSRLTTG